jgi:hypothetical protein
MEYNSFIEYLNIKELIKKQGERFKKDKSISKLINLGKEDDLKLFSYMFWEQTKGSTKLKKELGIPNSIKYVEILKAFPTEKYFEIITDHIVLGLSEDDVLQKYDLSSSQLGQLMIDTYINLEDRCCESCYCQDFQVKIIPDIYVLSCIKCRSSKIDYDKLMSIGEKEKRESLLKEKYEQYKLIYGEIILRLDSIKCPNCQGELCIKESVNWDKYKLSHGKIKNTIICQDCNYKAKDIEDVEHEYHQFLNKLKMREIIKSIEYEDINERLKVKGFEKLRYEVVDIITCNDADMHAPQFERISNEINESVNIIDEIKIRLNYCTRLERTLIIKLIETDEIHKEQLKINGVSYYKVLFDEPLVWTLINLTGIIIIRKLLIRLMNNFFLLVDEESNYLVMPDYLFSYLNLIQSYDEFQTVDNEIKYMIMKRQNFQCHSCKEDGKMLKLGYLTTNKNTQNLNDMVALCVDCHADYTKDDIIAEIIVAKEILVNDLCTSMQFIIKHYPRIKDNELVINTIIKFESKYGCSETIKALSIGLHSINTKKLDTTERFIAYVTAILRNSGDDGVKLYDTIYKKYNLDKWIIDKDCIMN